MNICSDAISYDVTQQLHLKKRTKQIDQFINNKTKIDGQISKLWNEGKTKQNKLKLIEYNYNYNMSDIGEKIREKKM